MAWFSFSAAQPAGQDIYIAPFAKGHGEITVGEITNITDRVGYDNQPCFAPGGSFLLYASYVDGQSDVYRYDIGSGKTSRVTNTPESEYSPTIIDAGTAFSSVRVEADSTQRLWRFNINGSDPVPVLPGVVSVGYHVWLNDKSIALFIVGDPHALHLANTESQDAFAVVTDIGRTMHRIPGTELLSFTRPVSEGDWRFFRYDAQTGSVTESVPLLEGSQDCAWTRDGEILMARADSLFMIRPDGDRTWRNVAVLGDRGVRSVTRLALSEGNEYIAVVAADAEPKEPPENE